jgi:hypothetical protein
VESHTPSNPWGFDDLTSPLAQIPIPPDPPPPFTLDDAIQVCYDKARAAETSAELYRQKKEKAAGIEADFLAERDRYFNEADALHKSKELQYG